MKLLKGYRISGWSIMALAAAPFAIAAAVVVVSSLDQRDAAGSPDGLQQIVSKFMAGPSPRQHERKN